MEKNINVENNRKEKNIDECCENCDFVVSSEMIENIMRENSEYANMSYEEVEKLIGNCELGYDIQKMSKKNFRFLNYSPNCEYKKLVKK